MIKIAPSILSADFADMGREIENLEKSYADFIHCDVMDGVFVPNITFGMPMIKAVRRFSALPFDVHLMIERPEKYVGAFIDAGADFITFHEAATDKTGEILELIGARGKKCGIALNPDIPLDGVEKYIEKLDMILIMSVFAGFGGQKFIPDSLKKIEAAAALKNKYNKNLLIEVDGGVTLDNIRDIENAGADIAVAGSSVFGAPDKAERIRLLKGERQ
ncbi:MAG: ribulose-phosphate 3-epimerase [Clostridiales bacterium]|jgi:ribulose-phosphate 3-epimerase|nr:ribulose-phosphate 3-epimerase [Clostridiales bacterium]